VALLAEGRVADAYDVARRHNPFASVCGRVCSAPCERACRRGVIDSGVSIRALKRVLCDVHGAERGNDSRWRRAVGVVPAESKPSVGIVGAGPAGLAAAHDLRLAGHAVTVYEAMPESGGMMRYGIPAFRLARDVLDAEIDAILALGITVRTGCALGRDVRLADLLARHAAVLLTVGCWRGRSLPVPGAGLPGVVRAVDFLRGKTVRVLGAEQPATAVFPASADAMAPGPVVVIGGGSVAFDAARSAWRAGSSGSSRSADRYDAQTALDAARSMQRVGGHSVTLLAPESRDQLPVPSEELHEADAEGVRVEAGVGVLRIVGESTVTGVEIAPVLSLFDAAGRFGPQLDVARSRVIQARHVVVAVGQQADTEFLSDTPSVTRSASGGVVVDAAMRTTDPRIWAAGDVSSGPRDLIDAVAAGQRAAASMIRTLALSPQQGAAGGALECRPARRDVEQAPAMQSRTRFWSGYDTIARVVLPVRATASRDTLTEVEASLSVRDARVEAARCLRCDEHMQFAPERCIACALCVDVCPQASLSLVPAGRSPDGWRHDRRLALLFDDDTCIRCGLCVHRCPTDALHFSLAPEGVHA
jgi:NADPH-dependent glutamate synthase beta subunit-like oxidoreductase